MVCPAGAVAEPLFVPVVEDDVAGEGRVIVVLLPAAKRSEQANETLTAAFRGNDVRQAAADGNGADKGCAPAVGILHSVVLRQRLVGVVQVNDGFMASVRFPTAKIAFGGLNDLHPKRRFSLRDLSVKSPRLQRVVSGNGRSKQQKYQNGEKGV